MHSAFLGEFLGTMVMILLGNGVVANVVLRQTKGEKSGWIVITTGWCFAVMAGGFSGPPNCRDRPFNPPPSRRVGRSPRALDPASRSVSAPIPRALVRRPGAWAPPPSP